MALKETTTSLYREGKGKHQMNNVPRLFLFVACMIPLHIAEQLVFGIDELYELRSMAWDMVSWLPGPDYGIVVQVGVVTTLVLTLCWAFMVGGLPRLIASGLFGFQFMVESHHVLKTIIRGEYFPGAVTAIVLVGLGAMIVLNVWRELKSTHRISAKVLA
jgi:hypothetical protein